MFQTFRSRTPPPTSSFHITETGEGLALTTQPIPGSRPLRSTLIRGLLDQLEEDGLAERQDQGYIVTWAAVYELMARPDDTRAAELFELPPLARVDVTLRSRGSLEDPTFSVALHDWRAGDHTVREAGLMGGVLTHVDGQVLVPEAIWRLSQAICAFTARPDSERTGRAHRLAWSQIRRLALAAEAGLDSFLKRTIVLTPEKLTIGIRRSELTHDRVIEIEPGFDGAPDTWLEQFDGHKSVPDRYDLLAGDGLVQVIVSPEVRTVLEEIKRLERRRVAGARAQAFIVNPYAALGQHANAVIDEQQFERARMAAGLAYERFLPRFERDAFGYPVKTGLLIETAAADGPTSSEVRWLDDGEMREFVQALRRALDAEFQLLGWKGYDFELQGDTPGHLRELEEAVLARRKPPILIASADVYDLSQYASRVEEIGVEKPYYSPYIARKNDDEGWFPDNIVPVITWIPDGASQPIALPLGPESVDELKRKVAEARATGTQEIHIAGCPSTIPIDEAERISKIIEAATDDAARGTLKVSSNERTIDEQPRKSPVVRANIQKVEYSEHRAEALPSGGAAPVLPSSLRPGVVLLPHQEHGVAWLQGLFEASKADRCRGAVLADDMGLGKTLQLLTMMAWAIENDPQIGPMLVVAPVSLLENWKREVDTFFVNRSLPVLTAYGEGLAALRVPRESVEQRLWEDGLVKFLRPDWVGQARVVLTTYETLRDLEFSFSRQRWSMMVCDEAQKIKNPAALVTRAAKKQNVGFRVACTGTPVENTLADLWCLFDFVQPGLLGALSEFGRRYRRPIEARTDEERARVDELRRAIAPQILRRTKSEVATELPAKRIVDDCRRLPLSTEQRALYAHAIEQFKTGRESGGKTPFKNHLGLLHHLRWICTDPRRYGTGAVAPEPLEQYQRRAPKLEWLLKQLRAIRAQNEKVIVFCEFRDIQRLLQHYIDEAVGVRPDIINGDSATSTNHANSRQKRIDQFQQRSGFGIIVLSPVAVGFGLNIQAANHVIHYTRAWNPAKEDQATDRAHRIGQKKTVYVYYPVVCADDFTTFDVKLDQLLEQKRALASDMLNGAGDLLPGEFRIDDVTPGDKGTDSLDRVTAEIVQSMTWDYCEGLVSALYARRGFQTYRTPGQDNGVDVVVLSRDAPVGKLVQVKSSSRFGRSLGWDGIKDVVSGHAFYDRKFPGVAFTRTCVTNQHFNEQAHDNARLNAVELVEQPQLLAMLEETPVTMLDIEQALGASWNERISAAVDSSDD